MKLGVWERLGGRSGDWEAVDIHSKLPFLGTFHSVFKRSSYYIVCNDEAFSSIVSTTIMYYSSIDPYADATGARVPVLQVLCR